MKRKQILSLLLALLMLFSVLPLPAFAETDGLDAAESDTEESFDWLELNDSLPDETEQEETPSETDPEDDSWLSENEDDSEETPFQEDTSNVSEEIQVFSEDEDSVDASALDDSEENEDESSADDDSDENELTPEEPESDVTENPEPEDTADDTAGSVEQPSLDDIVLTEYDGSYIRYTIANTGHAYVKTKGAITVYSDSSLTRVLCGLPNDGEVLLGTDYDATAHSVAVPIVTPEMDVLEGYVRESDLSKVVVTDAEADDLAVEKDYILLQIGDTFYPVFLPAVHFTGADSVEESSEETVEESEEPSTDEEETGESGDDSFYTVNVDDFDFFGDFQGPYDWLQASGVYVYTIYADHDPAIPISTRPIAYMAGNRQGFTTIDQGNDGSDFRSIHQSYNMKGQQVTVLGFTRYHHAVITCEWYDSSANVTRRLLTEAAYMRPVEKTYSCTVRDHAGNIAPNHEVRVLDGKGNYVTTVMSDANGVARYTGLHLDVSAMLAFAEANYVETSSNTMIEDNDCASFVSECLTAGGFPVYGAYASNSEANEGQIGYGLYNRLVSWIGVPGTANPSVQELSPGDTVFMQAQSNE